jgi:hypothetical protein
MFLIGVLVVLGSHLVHAATVTGTITYDGVPVTSAFDDIASMAVNVWDNDTSQTVNGIVDLASSTYNVTGPTAGHSFAVFVQADRSDPADGSAYEAGDLQTGSAFTVIDPEETVTVDLPIRMVMRIRSPFDSMQPVPANGLTCPIGFETASPATLAWDAVAGAQTYEITVLRRTCDHVTLTTDRYTTTETSQQIPLGALNEDYTLIMIRCPGASSPNLCFVPLVSYLDNAVQSILLRLDDGSSPGRSAHHTDAYFLPAVASAPGVAPTYWTSAVIVTNLSPDDATVHIVFTPSESDGSLDFHDVERGLPAGSSLNWDNVLQNLFAVDGVGSLEIRGPNLAVTSRTATPASSGGSYGQGIPSAGPDQVLSLAGVATATQGGVVENQAFRTNLGLCETWGETATVEVTVSTSEGIGLGSRQIALRPYENLQVNRVVRDVTPLSTLDNAIVKVTVVGGNGRVAAYLSTIDNTTGDPTYTAIAPSRPTGG